MKILAVSDTVEKRFYDFYEPGRLDEYGLIVSAGDLSREYLEFLVTMAHCPLVYVPGNHDTGFLKRPPEGCISADDMVLDINGVRIMGLGGSFMYNRGAFQYTEKNMRHRYLKLRRRMKLKPGYPKGVDLLLTHAPVRGHFDTDFPAHRGFEVFGEILREYRPKYMVHGHMHRNYGVDIPRESRLHDTTVINAQGYCVIEI